jgi:two-component system, OmpR family, sensor histidine kinase MprB
MTLRAKLVLALALLAAASTVSIGFFSYTATEQRLNTQINNSLSDAIATMVDRVSHGDHDAGLGGPNAISLSGDAPLVRQQAIAPDGTIAGSSYGRLPVTAGDRALAAGGPFGAHTVRTVTIDGQHWRIETFGLGGGGAVQAARSLAENENVLASLRDRILIAAALVVIAAGLIGWWFALQVTRRLTRLTNTAEEVAQTGHLDIAVPVSGKDEAGRLGIAFNEMLSALARSKDDQQRLVQDAGHELRTPLTSLRTNASVLRRHELSPTERTQVLDDLDSEARELTDLVNELVELATDRSRDEPEELLRVADIVERVAQRAERRSGRHVAIDADTTVVVGRRQALERAISNLVDNALKFDQGDGPIEVVVKEGTVTVLDRGPGIEASDRDHLFDRFFRALSARSQPGSGLGLAIVRDIAERHGGTVFAGPRDGGGAAIGFRLPVADGDAEPAEQSD